MNEAAASATRYPLFSHPSTPCAFVQGITVQVAPSSPQRCELLFELAGDVAQLRLPEPRPAVRAEGLWRHTCFEAFLAIGVGKEYWELNFSPSAAWAAYQFRAYRAGMTALTRGAPPLIECETTASLLRLRASVDLSWLGKFSQAGTVCVGLTAVVEDRAGLLSYWALAHPAEKPDFHHADSFIARL